MRARVAWLTYAAAIVAFVVYAVGFVASFWLPEPKDELPEATHETAAKHSEARV